MSSRITPFLSFASRGEEAVRFYLSIFPNSRLEEIARYGPGGMLPEGALLAARFTLDGQPFVAIDGGPSFEFAQGVSLYVDCKDQAEIDLYYGRLVEGGTPSRCGWLTDKFGLSWQVIPHSLGEMLSDAEHGDTAAALEAMLGMEKIDLARLEAAYARH